MKTCRFNDAPVIAFDTEATGLRFPIDRAFGFAIAVPVPGHRQPISEYWDLRQTPQVIEWFNDAIQQYKGVVVCHNASYDYLMAYNAGIRIPLRLLDDTVIRASLIDEHFGRYDLDSLALEWVGEGKMDPWEELAKEFGGRATRNAQAGNLHRAPSDIVGKYCKQDAIVTLKLWQAQETEIDSQNDTQIPLRKIVEFERKLMPTVIKTQRRGVRVDPDAAEKAMLDLTPHIDNLQKQLNLYSKKGELNINSSPQIRDLFEPTHRPGMGWVAVDGTPVPSTGKGAPSFGANVLRAMSHPAAKMIQELRSLKKTRDTFLGSHILKHMVHIGDEFRVFPNINQSKSDDGSGVGPGRFSYTDPALQQIPARNKEIAAIVKPCFLPDEGMVWAETDKHTFEVRIFAGLAKVPAMLKAYQMDPMMDGHQFVADLTGLPRNARFAGDPNAKQLDLAMIFNQGNGSTAELMGMPWEWDEFEPKDKPGTTIRYKKAGPEAKSVIEKYHRFMPGVKELADGCKSTAINRGFVRTSFGRRIRFPRGYKAYKASGLLIQATAADYNKENWMLIEEECGDQGHLILNTHDSYGLSLYEDTWQESLKRVKAAIERPDRFTVPFVLDLDGCGDNWWSAINDKFGANASNSRVAVTGG